MTPVLAPVVFGVLVVLSVIWLPSLHPVQLWAVPWLAATTLHAADLLPYRTLSSATVALVIGGGLAFCTGAWAAGRGREPRHGVGIAADVHGRLGIAAAMLLALTAVWLAAFLAQVSSRYGLRATLVSSPDVREAIGAGELAMTIKFVYAALAAAVICALAAATARRSKQARFWLGGALAACASTYFSTGRSNVVTALIMAALAYAIARPLRPRPWQLAASAAVLALVVVVALLAGGRLIGKTYANSELATIETTFTEHRTLEPLALPYQYATAPIASLNELVAVTGTFGETEGCATATPACTALSAVGLPAEPVPAIRAFTARPLQWNTYTALDAPLMDGGRALALLIVAGLGCLVGVSWRAARRGTVPGVVVFTAMGTATLFSAVQNNFFAFHYLGAILLCLLAWFAARRVPASGSPGSVITRFRARIGFASAVLLAALVVVGCGGSDNETSQKVAQRSVVDEAPPLKDVLVTEAQIDGEPTGSARRAFLTFWQLLQYQGFAEAVADYESGLVDAMGADQIAESLKGQAPYFRSVRPQITGTVRRRNSETVLFQVKDINGDVTPRSVTWRRSDGNWRIHYDPYLDVAMRDQIQNATQMAIDPTAQTSARRAIQAGFNAGRIQSTYLKSAGESSASGD